MKSKAPLALMEQIVMLLVFSLAAAVCLQAFAAANRISRDNSARDQAALKAETAAEVYKSCGGKNSLAVKKLGGGEENGAWVTWWDGEWKETKTAEGAAYRVSVKPKPGEDLLGRASVTAAEISDGKELFSVEIAWQEASTDG